MSSYPTTPIDRDPEHLDDALPWYSNGTLAPQDEQWVREQLADPQRAAQTLRLDTGIGNALNEHGAEVPADIGWDGLLSKVRSDAQPSRPAVQAETDKPRGSISDFFASLLSPRFGMAMAAVLAVQTVAIGYLVNEKATPAYTEYRSVGATTQVPVLRVIFSDDVTEQQMRRVLYDSELSIVGGPNQLGEYLLRAPQGDLATLAAQLKKDGVLAHFSIDQKVITR